MTRNIKEFVNQNCTRPTESLKISSSHVCVLLAHFNGANRLGEQLTSLAMQSHKDWSLIISDDGSSDHWLEVATQFAETRANGRTWLISGPRQGYARNFLALANIAGPFVPFAAFCDQDDVWMPGKLARAVEKLGSIPGQTPAMYCGRTIICDDDLRARRLSPLFDKAPSFRNALVQNIGGGNTMVLNRAALDLLQDTSRHAQNVVSHDWWVYQLITGAGGKVIYDTEPSLYYRQHAGNLIGANDTLAASVARIGKLLRGRYQSWNAANTMALFSVQHWLTEDARKTLATFNAARQGTLLQRLRCVHRSGVYRQTRRGTAALWLAALTKRL